MQASCLNFLALRPTMKLESCVEMTSSVCTSTFPETTVRELRRWLCEKLVTSGQAQAWYKYLASFYCQKASCSFLGLRKTSDSLPHRKMAQPLLRWQLMLMASALNRMSAEEQYLGPISTDRCT
jgi:hypothetical protein